MVAAERAQVLDGERAIQRLLQSREGGETEVSCPVGRVDLLTDKHVIEIKHVSKWIDGCKVALYATHFSDRKPRVHLFGGYTRETREQIEKELAKLEIETTWEKEPF